MTIYDAFSLLGGLAFFLFGMKLLGEALERRAGNRLKPILESLTTKPAKGVLVGIVVTAIVQSSSATTVMLVGFVNSGIMQLSQAINVIMGANIGTTVTSWILSLAGIQSDNFFISLFKPTTFSPILAFIGIIMLFAFERKKDIATILIGFSILMTGMDIMGNSVSGLSEVPEFVRILTLFSNPFLGVLAGAVITGIIQSSAASIGMLQALALSGSVTWGAAIPIIMGQNIGTCVTAIISSVGSNKNAKRVGIAHLFFNIIGTLLFLALFYGIKQIFHFTFTETQIGMVGIAIVHTLFNLLSTLVLFPFSKQLEKLARFIIRDDKGDDKFEMLDDRLISTPSIAIEQCRKLTNEMAILSRDAFLKSLDTIKNYNEKEAILIEEMESKVDIYEDKLGSYLVKLSMQNLSKRDSQESSKLLHVIGDFERISDHAKNIVEASQEMNDKGVSFSNQAHEEVAVISAAVTEILQNTIKAFLSNDIQLASQVEPLEEVIDKLRSEIRGRHIQRLQSGSCTIELGFILSDILTSLERVADHCSNIAASVIEMEKRGMLDAHEYLKNIKSGGESGSFKDMYEDYTKKYSIIDNQ